MPDYRDAVQSPLCDLEDVERYQLRGSGEIRSQLLNLAKKPDIITAYFNEGRDYFLTAVLGIVKERGLVVLDYGPDEAVTRRAIGTDRLVCTTRHQGIPVRFICENLQGARYQGKPAIATPLPQSLYRMQRREFFRVTTPRINCPRCDIATDDSRHTLNVVDLSCGGAGIVDFAGDFAAEPLQCFEQCHINLPDFGEVKLMLEIRNRGSYISASGERFNRFGVAFRNLTPSDNALLQRYIFQLQTLQPD